MLGVVGVAHETTWRSTTRDGEEDDDDKENGDASPEDDNNIPPSHSMAAERGIVRIDVESIGMHPSKRQFQRFSFCACEVHVICLLMSSSASICI